MARAARVLACFVVLALGAAKAGASELAAAFFAHQPSPSRPMGDRARELLVRADQIEPTVGSEPFGGLESSHLGVELLQSRLRLSGEEQLARSERAAPGAGGGRMPASVEVSLADELTVDANVLIVRLLEPLPEAEVRSFCSEHELVLIGAVLEEGLLLTRLSSASAAASVGRLTGLFDRIAALAEDGRVRSAIPNLPVAFAGSTCSVCTPTGLDSAEWRLIGLAEGSWTRQSGHSRSELLVLDSGFAGSSSLNSVPMFTGWAPAAEYLAGLQGVCATVRPGGHGLHVAGIAQSLLDLSGPPGEALRTCEIGAIEHASDVSAWWLQVERVLNGLDNYLSQGNRLVVNLSLQFPESLRRASASAYRDLLHQQFGNDVLGTLADCHQQVLFVAAAGNDGSCAQGASPFTLAAGRQDGLDNLIVVEAATRDGGMFGLSNTCECDFGAACPAVRAPGECIQSLAPGGQRGCESGTSQAAPFVSGLAALVWDRYPTLTPAQVIAAIRASTAGGGVINAQAAEREARMLSLGRSARLGRQQ